MTKIFGTDSIFLNVFEKNKLRRDQSPGEDGFMLIEALIALAICSLAVVALIRFSQISATVQNRTSIKAQAVLEARNIIGSVGTEVNLVQGVQKIELPSGHTATITIEPHLPNLQQGTQRLEQMSLYGIFVTIDAKKFGTVASLYAVRARDLY